MQFTTNLFDEAERVKRLHTANNQIHPRVGLSTYDPDLCKGFLYHFVSGNQEHLHNAPLFHLPHQSVPFGVGTWDPALLNIIRRNQEVTVITDGEVQPPNTVWLRAGERQVGPVYGDDNVQFRVKRYHSRHPDDATARASRDREVIRRNRTRMRGIYLLDEYTAEMADGVPADDYHLQYRIFKFTLSDPRTSCWNI